MWKECEKEGLHEKEYIYIYIYVCMYVCMTESLSCKAEINTW